MARRAADHFADDVREHELTIIKDDGVHRHIRMRQPGTYNMSYDIITWPGYLAYVGDMGDFLFSRIEDMFEFFRSPDGRVNYGYWAEKCEAEDKRLGLERFDEDAARDAVRRKARSYADEAGLGRAEYRQLLEDAKDQIDYSDEHAFFQSVDAFEFRRFESDEFGGGRGRLTHRDTVFVEMWDYNLKTYTYHFEWCCHAIVHAINAYDKAKDPKPVPPELVRLAESEMPRG